ncbi:CPBP family intramembrane metalloprotease [Proteobacteria bacterium 005FR1]|nr:CPBP family intramembrane metalloprotease [Proteobacteria bacterium 005FR1]
MLKKLKDCFVSNTVSGLLTPPWRAPLKSWALLPVFAACALPLGLVEGVLQLDPAKPDWPLFFAISVFVSPAFLEEFVFRGLLIPRDIARRGRRSAWLAIAASTSVYTLAHPLGALTTSPAAKSFFLEPAFLSIVALLGITCSYSYVVSRSLWVPVIIHWAVVLVWVLLFGGHQLVIALEGHAWAFQ